MATATCRGITALTDLVGGVRTYIGIAILHLWAAAHADEDGYTQHITQAVGALALDALTVGDCDCEDSDDEADGSDSGETDDGDGYDSEDADSYEDFDDDEFAEAVADAFKTDGRKVTTVEELRKNIYGGVEVNIVQYGDQTDEDIREALLAALERYEE